MFRVSTSEDFKLQVRTDAYAPNISANELRRHQQAIFLFGEVPGVSCPVRVCTRTLNPSCTSHPKHPETKSPETQFSKDLGQKPFLAEQASKKVRRDVEESEQMKILNVQEEFG